MLTPGTQVRWWLQWAAVPYGLLSLFRAALYRRGWLAQRKLPVFVVSVGNLTVGGTGKTPLVILLAEWLLASGKRVAILSRGYRRTGSAPMLLVSNGDRLLVTADEAGDEPYLMAQRCPKAIVAVGADRYAVGRWILGKFSVDCVLLDDGFQHLALHRDVNLLLIDATDVRGLQAVLPAGRLREFPRAAARASMILITRADDPDSVGRVMARLGSADSPLPPTARVVFVAEGLVSVTTGRLQPREWCRGKKVILCSGIGHAASFRALAETLGLHVLDEHVFADHYRYGPRDVRKLQDRATELGSELVVTTEKDATKLSALLEPTNDEWWALRLATCISAGEDQLRRLVVNGSQIGSREACA